jgi:predicted metalloprotease
MRLFALGALPATVALVLLAGCGGDDGGSSGDDGGDVQLQERTEVALDEDEGTKAPDGVEVLEELPELQRASGDDALPALRGSEGLTLAEWLETVTHDVALFWQQEFNTAGYTYPSLFFRIFEQPVTSQCGGTVPADAGPSYCPADRTIFLSLPFFSVQAQRYGDAGPAIIVAHENGHHVQNALGLFDQGLKVIQEELQADCLAGVWAASVLQRGLLEPDDIGEILGEVEAAGDAPGTPVEGPLAHGTSQQRRKAFYRGYNRGRPNACPVPPVPAG